MPGCEQCAFHGSPRNSKKPTNSPCYQKDGSKSIQRKFLVSSVDLRDFFKQFNSFQAPKLIWQPQNLAMQTLEIT